jgi:hypothetical protein
MAKYKIEEAGPDGWSDWIQPIMEGYRLACCDCGLVHEVEFRALQVGRNMARGRFTAMPMDQKRYRVEMRLKRNKRATAAMRRTKQRETS